MTLQVIGAGIGRTGTYSLKLALEQLGLGPCYHMEEVLKNQAVHVPLWAAAAEGRHDWSAIFEGYASAVDWPTAGFYRDLCKAYPSAKFVLTHRSPQSWRQSFSETIHKLVTGEAAVPPDMQPWLEMARAVIARNGVKPGLDATELEAAYIAHNEEVQAAIPGERLLVFEVKEGWTPLCDFLGVAAPDGPFPRSNDRAEFWDRVSGKA